MQYVYLAMGALVFVMFAYKKLSASKKTNEYLSEKDSKKNK